MFKQVSYLYKPWRRVISDEAVCRHDEWTVSQGLCRYVEAQPRPLGHLVEVDPSKEVSNCSQNLGSHTETWAAGSVRDTKKTGSGEDCRESICNIFITDIDRPAPIKGFLPNLSLQLPM